MPRAPIQLQNRNPAQSPEPPQPQKILVCRKCDYKQPDGTFCRSCGEPIEEPKPDPKGVSRFTLLRLGAVLAVIGGFYLFHKESAPAPPDSTRIYTPPDVTAVGALAPAPGNSPNLTPQDLVDLAAPLKVTLLLGSAEHPKTGAAGLLLQPGYIATTLHATKPNAPFAVRFEDGSVAMVRHITAQVEDRDIAIFSIDKAEKNGPTTAALSQILEPKNPKAPLESYLAGTTQPNLGSANILNPGDTVFALGPQKGVDSTIDKGLITGRHGSILQTNIQVAPTTSGTALFNKKGEIVGLLTDRLMPPQNTPDTEGKTFALPIEWAIEAMHAAPAIASGGAAISTNTFGPYTFTLTAHQIRSIRFTTPTDLDTAALTATFTAKESTTDLVIKVLRDKQVIYDSSASMDNTLKLKLKRGTYTLTLENPTANARTATLVGTFTPAP